MSQDDPNITTVMIINDYNDIFFNCRGDSRLDLGHWQEPSPDDPYTTVMISNYYDKIN